jgi:hypothetical protein
MPRLTHGKLINGTLPVSETLSLQQIMENAIGGNLELKTGDSTLPCRFPIVVSPATREFLEIQSKALNQSLASLCGLILDQVAAETLKRAAVTRLNSTK